MVYDTASDIHSAGMSPAPNVVVTVSVTVVVTSDVTSSKIPLSSNAIACISDDFISSDADSMAALRAAMLLADCSLS